MLEITEFYTREERNYTHFYYDALDAFASDIAFNCPVSFFAQSASKRLPGNVFTYVISKHPQTHYINVIPPFDFTGVCHADELSFVFGQAFKNKVFFDDNDRAFSRELIEVFAEFAHSGKPTRLSNNQSWPASDAEKEQLNYVNLDLNRRELRPFDLEKRCNRLWWKMHRKLRETSPYSYTKLPPKRHVYYFAIFFIVICVLVIIIAFIEWYISRKRTGYQKYY